MAFEIQTMVILMSITFITTDDQRIKINVTKKMFFEFSFSKIFSIFFILSKPIYSS